MELKQVVVNNTGMSQDVSISKQDNKRVFENRNIRIQASDDGTLLSVTNLKSPIPLGSNSQTPAHELFGFRYKNRHAAILGGCLTPEYLILFTKEGTYNANTFEWTNEHDCIYRINLESLQDVNNPVCETLYDGGENGGNLGFDTNHYIDTLYYEEGQNVKKVYWVDGVNSPRVINIITPSERAGGSFSTYTKNQFEFFPNLYQNIPTQNYKVNVAKNRTVPSEIPAGMIQYFITLFNVNGAETPIIQASDLYTVDFNNRGAKPDEVGMCAFDIDIPVDIVNTDFDYIRVYSATRTSYDGPLTVKIVGDLAINANYTSYKITDTGINQEQVPDSFLYFVGGTPFVAKTLTEKDGTAFFGNIGTENVQIPSAIKTALTNCTIQFYLGKELPAEGSFFGDKYPYKLQLDGGTKTYRTFKAGETYRFGIQFQDKRGQWTEVCFLQDVKCLNRPEFNELEGKFEVNDCRFSLNGISTLLEDNGFINYRILMADPSNSNGRKIKAQGILCPTMFTPGQRAGEGTATYSLPSWVMRPKKGQLAYHHFEPIFSSVVDGGEIASYTPGGTVDQSNIKYTTPFGIINSSNSAKQDVKCYIVTYIVLSPANKLIVRSVKIWADDEMLRNNFYHGDGSEPTPDEYEVLCDYYSNYGGPYGAGGHYFDALNGNPFEEYKVNNKIIFPYGLTATKKSNVSGDSSASVKYTYLQGDDPDNQEVRGLIPALNLQNVSEESTASVSFLEGCKEDINRSKLEYISKVYKRIWDATGSGFEFNIGNEFYEGNLNSYLVDYDYRGFVPLFAKTTSNTSWNTSRIDGNVYVHHAYAYETGSIYNNETNVFSAIKTTYRSGSTGNPHMICTTLPEIFRPRCTVNGPTTIEIQDQIPEIADAEKEVWKINSNDDADYKLYQHDMYNLELPGGDSEQVVHPYEGMPRVWLHSAYSDDWTYHTAFIQILPIVESQKDIEISSTYNDYYVDESIITLHSPDIDSISNSSNELGFRIIGVVPLNKSVVNVDADAVFANPVIGNVRGETIKTLHNNKEFYPFYSDFLFSDFSWNSEQTKLDASLSALYKTYLFSANNFLGIITDEEIEDLQAPADSGIINTQQILNQYYGENTIYFPVVTNKDSKFDYGYVPVVKTDEENGSYLFETEYGIKTYRPIYDNLIQTSGTITATSHIYDDFSVKLKNKLTAGQSRVKFSSTSHAVINLKHPNSTALALKKYLLPHFKWDSEDYFRTIYDGKPFVFSDNTASNSELNKNYPRGEWKQNAMQEIIGSTAAIYNYWGNEAININTEINQDLFLFIPVNLYTIKQSLPEIAEYISLDAIFYNHSIIDSRGIETDEDWLWLEAYSLLKGYITNYLNTYYYEDASTLFNSLFNVLNTGYDRIDNTYSGGSSIEFTKKQASPVQVTLGLYGYDYLSSQYLTIESEKVVLDKITMRWAEDNETYRWIYYPSELYISNPDNPTAPEPESQIVTETIIYKTNLDTLPREWFIDWINDLEREQRNITSSEVLFNFKWHYEHHMARECHMSDPEDLDEFIEILPISQLVALAQFKDVFPVDYISPELDTDITLNNPYLFIGEIYEDIPDSELYGGPGTDETVLRRLTWIPISEITPVTVDTVNSMDGDTYYQRWDCLKTFPTTEEDINQIVDITSFMVETHKNLDARCDVNRATYKLTARPANFNLFNPVYNQLNNLFEYTTSYILHDLENGKFPNRIVWSGTKNILGDVDSWTNLSVENFTTVKYPVTKLVNFNNSVTALTEHSIEVINFNEKNLVPSTDNSLIELQNSQKVNGTTKLQSPYGTHNMSTLITERGLYFIDDNENAFIRINAEGITNLAANKLTDWFHRNIVSGTNTLKNYSGPFHLEYDAVHKDVYIVGMSKCLVYNESMDEFTSFIDYTGNYWLFNYQGLTYIYRNFLLSDLGWNIGIYLVPGRNGLHVYVSDYNRDFGYREYGASYNVEGSPLEYSISYMINPNPYTDKVFTNATLMADLGITGTDGGYNPDSTLRAGEMPFTTVQVWNEYQDTGSVVLEKILDKVSNLKQKFRFWRFEIPRQSGSTYPRNRIRSPWARMKLSGDSTYKMEFHNMTIQYME